MKKWAIIGVFVLSVSGCSSNQNLEDDVERLQKLPAAVGVAVELRGPAYVAAIGIILLSMQGITVKVIHKRKTKAPKQ